LGQAVTASETFISSFPARSSQDIQFTWPQSIAKTVRSCSIPTDVVLGIDVSGSMNNDSENPPQPLTDALTAAQAFIGTLNELDQVGVVTFATAATLAQPLTTNHAAAAQLVSALSIAAADETGFTNTSAALAQAATELRSDRANNNARRAFVLLTDGLPTAQGDTDAVAAAIASAQALVASGADVYAIGLGENVDQAFLAALASDPAYAYLAPTRTDLDEIYAQVTASLCEVGPTKIEVIAKTKTNFAPLR
jgi:Mg-chelatase subunit ChlD